MKVKGQWKTTNKKGSHTWVVSIVTCDVLDHVTSSHELHLSFVLSFHLPPSPSSPPPSLISMASSSKAQPAATAGLESSPSRQEDESVFDPESSPLVHPSDRRERLQRPLGRELPAHLSDSSERLESLIFIPQPENPTTPEHTTANLPDSDGHGHWSPSSKPRYVLNTPFAATGRLTSIEDKDANTQYLRHAVMASRVTIGTMPMDLFMNDKKLCPPMPAEPLPDVDPKMFEELEMLPGEKEMQKIIVSLIYPIIR